MTTLLLVPLDERPANVRYPALVAAVGGARLLVAPQEALGAFREPGDHRILARWLGEHAPAADAVIVSTDQLVFGGLVPSRLTDEPGAVAVGRLRALVELAAHAPVIAFSTVTRAPDTADATEEPAYWSRHGPELHRLGALLDASSRGEQVASELSTLRDRLPAEVVRDLSTRRLRNHMVLLAAIELAARDVLRRLVICVDDTAPRSWSSLESRSLRSWIGDLGLPPGVVLQPGADEVGSTLVARTLVERSTAPPTVDVACADPSRLEAVPAYEDRPLSATVDAQIRTVGAERARADGADLTLVVHPPSPDGGDWAIGPEPVTTDDSRRRAAATAGLVGALAESGAVVAVADVAYANGADPALVDELGERIELTRLAGYAAWNTASNSVGGVLAQAVLVASGGDQQAHRRLLAHRLVEDHGYQAVARQELRRWLAERGVGVDPPPDLRAEAAHRVEEQLARELDALPGLRTRLREGSVRLVWGQSFHVDFELEDVAP